METTHLGSADKWRENCRNCQRICEEMVERSLKTGITHAKSSHISILVTCASICKTTSEFVRKHSALQIEPWEECSRICEECADSCETLGPSMEECVEACRICAETCREMSRGEK